MLASWSTVDGYEYREEEDTRFICITDAIRRLVILENCTFEDHATKPISLPAGTRAAISVAAKAPTLIHGGD